jgi:CheY-like chemotaxis protein
MPPVGRPSEFNMLKVVVIEEDIAMRALIGEWLVGEGHDVRALSTVDAPRGGGDLSAQLVVVDLVNLRWQGAQAIHAVQLRFPQAKVIGMSTQVGRSLGANSETLRGLGLVRLLAKPCEREELLEALAEASVNGT